MKSLTKNACLSICLAFSCAASLGIHPVAAFAQEREEIPQQEIHNAPENVSGTLEGNQADLLSSWRFLSGLAVRLLSGNEAELLSGNEPELLSGNSAELLSGNAPELLSRNKPVLLSGNKVVLFSNNSLQIHFADSGNYNTSALGNPPRNVPSVRARSESQGEFAARQEARLRAQMQATAARTRDAIEKEREQAKHLTAELSVLRAKLQEVAAQNKSLQARIAELESSQQ
jgi:hypothetical protein